MGIFGKKNEVAARAKKKAKQQAKGNGVNATNAGRILRGVQDEIDRNRRNQSGGKR